MTALTPQESESAPLLIDGLKRADWVDMQLVQSFMRYTKQSMLTSCAVSWIMASMVYRSAPVIWLLSWLVLFNVVNAGRYLAAVRYQKLMSGVSGLPLRNFLARYDFLWVSSGVLWGASSFLFVGNAVVFEQFVCGLILIGVSCFTVYSYASRLKCYFAFSNSLMGTTLGVFIYYLLTTGFLPSTSDSVSLIVLVAMFHVMLRYFAIHFHELQFKSLQLQFDNSQLIQTLTAKSTAALEAIENKNRFIASAAHDLRQPVHALNLYASWLADEPQLATQVAPQIVRCTRAVNELFDSLFDF